MQTIRWGIIGCGDVTEVKSGPAFQKIQHSELVAVMRRNGAKAQDYAQRHQVPTWYDKAEDLINDPKVDAVYIATPPSSHAAYARQVVAAGKAVYVEKPMALSYQESQAMLEASQQAQVPLFVAYYRRCLPSFLKVKELVEAGAIGKVRYVNVQLCQPPKPSLDWRVRPEIAGGGLFFDLAAHQLDFLDYLLGPIESAAGQAANQAGLYAAEDIVTAQFRFRSGVLGSGVWCFSVAEQQRKDFTEVVGSLGAIRFPSFRDEPVVLETKAGVQQFSLPNPPHVQQPLIQTIVDELRGHGQCPSTGESAARTAWVMDQIMGRLE
ncbi:Gfo/Idh/MocA family oxidoreductase [Pontibacter qinzhouensis]|uniref:Gfo/Idh/MocA family oxidoreductase n=1 Tax=Pontibacter qinzhouensis TaxID=2603253 RepID=A0A5C8KCD7_9BACT|nr:Gfo/Idh/MocA family oxidoreductase [Pontibacter qinzhouensis]TXK48892.1 Gfo/Idh/MocA family oxidoreductase [Pontibacter qinzhouensis]